MGSNYLSIALILISQIGRLQLLNSKYDVDYKSNTFDYSYSYIDQFVPLPPDYETWDPGLQLFILFFYAIQSTFG